jgi:hypothetical protein
MRQAAVNAQAELARTGKSAAAPPTSPPVRTLTVVPTPIDARTDARSQHAAPSGGQQVPITHRRKAHPPGRVRSG